MEINELKKVASQYKKDIIGIDDIKNEAHLKVVYNVIMCFGKKPDGFIIVEACLPKSSDRPADIVICDTTIGFLVIEVKGQKINKIENVISQKLVLNEREQISPWEQARNFMFDVKNSYKKKFPDEKPPWFTYIVVFSNIEKKEWIDKFKTENIPFNETIFKDELNEEDFSKKINNRLILPESGKKISNPINLDQIKKIRNILGESAAILNERKYRKIDEDALGMFFDNIENEFKVLSPEQQRLSRLEIDGRPRLIRGVAGSGKTIVLANFAVRALTRFQQNLFDFNKDGFKIGIFCFNKTLIHFIKEKIEKAYKELKNESLPQGNYEIKTFLGFIYDRFVKKLKIIIPEEWEEIFNKSKIDNTIFLNLLDKNNIKIEPEFDIVFIDEGQDLNEEDYILMQKFIKKDPKTGNINLIIFYDDAQNIYGKKRPIWKKLGIDILGDRSDVMKICYRNTENIITLALNFLICSAMDEKNKPKTFEFADMTTLINSKINNKTLIEREGYFYRVNFALKKGELPIIKKFDKKEDELNWIVKEVGLLIKEQKVRSDDILILTFKSNFAENISKEISKKMQEFGIERIIKPYEDDDKNEFIFKENCLTISTIHGAKGYDANVVFFVGIEELNPYLEKDRAIFYVAVTRAKYRIYITGNLITGNGKLIFKELEAIMEYIKKINSSK